MLIRSHDKLKITPMREFEISAQGNFKIGYWGIWNHDDYFICYGEYSTNAKAIKVLDMIENAYEFSFENTEDMGNTCPRYPQVFQMPQDTEVEG